MAILQQYDLTLSPSSTPLCADQQAQEEINCPELAIEFLKGILAPKDREHFVVVALDARLRPIGYNTVSIGSLSASIVHPREVFKFAILSNAASVLLMHNHPSGDTTPSQDDKDLTERMAKAGQILGMDVVDHVIVSGWPACPTTRLHSMRAEGEGCLI